MSPSISNFIGGTVDSTVLLLLAIVLCALLFEDLAIIGIGVLAADGSVPILIALLALSIGVIMRGGAFYALGSFARTHPRLAHYIDHDLTTPFRSWLSSRYAFNIFSAHFVPGLRFATNVASGFFRFSFSTFLFMSTVGGILLVIVLFSASYWFGSITSGWVSHIRWGIAGAFFIALFFIGRHNLLVYRTKKIESETTRQSE